jgi:hypothetical protein
VIQKGESWRKRQEGIVRTSRTEGKEDGLMKKGMIVMTIVAALVFFVSMIAAAPSSAVQATQTGPTPKQAPIQSPQTKFERSKDVVHQLKPHAEFWGLAVDHCNVNGAPWPRRGSQSGGVYVLRDLQVKAGQPLTFDCYYKVITIPIKDITEDDAIAWGSGKSYTDFYKVFISTFESSTEISAKTEQKNLPKFTWADVLVWKRQTGRSNDSKIWTEHMVFTWAPTQEYLQKILSLSFYADCFDNIKEFNGNDNNHAVGTMYVTP